MNLLYDEINLQYAKYSDSNEEIAYENINIRIDPVYSLRIRNMMLSGQYSSKRYLNTFFSYDRGMFNIVFLIQMSGKLSYFDPR